MTRDKASPESRRKTGMRMLLALLFLLFPASAFCQQNTSRVVPLFPPVTSTTSTKGEQAFPGAPVQMSGMFNGVPIAVHVLADGTLATSGGTPQQWCLPCTPVGGKADNGTTVALKVDANGNVQISGTPILLQTNGTNNGSQNQLNLVAGSGLTITDNRRGSITISGTGNPAGPTNSVQTNNGSGGLAGSSLFQYSPESGLALSSDPTTAILLMNIGKSPTTDDSSPVMQLSYDASGSSDFSRVTGIYVSAASSTSGTVSDITALTTLVAGAFGKGHTTHSSGIAVGSANFEGGGADSALNEGILVADQHGPNITAGYAIHIAGQSSGGVYIGMDGASSGTASIGVAASAGTPNPLNLPTTTLAANNCLASDGGNPQQLFGLPCAPVTNHSGTAAASPHIVQDTATLSSGTITVTLTGTAAFTSATTFTCSANDVTTPGNIVTCAQTDGSHITLAASGASDVVVYTLTGH
jgi:hypothetical protein